MHLATALIAKLIAVAAGPYKGPLFLLAALVAAWLFRKPAAASRAAAALMALGLAMAVAFSASALAYLFLDQYFDHIEPEVAVIALNWLHGLPIHPDWTGADGPYGLVYGPLLFELVGVPLILSKTVLATKLLGVAAFVAATAAMVGLAQRRPGVEQRRMLVIYLLLWLGNGALPFWVRGDPFLILIVAAGALAIGALPAWAAATALGLLAGLGADIKAHAFLYVAPLFAALLFRPGVKMRNGLVLCAVALAAAVVGLGAPLGFDPNRLASYIAYLREMSAHGVSPLILVFNVGVAAALAAPCLARLLAGRGASPPRPWAAPAVLFACMALVCVIAAKPGAGFYHLLPFIPTLLLFSLEAPSAREPGRASAAFLFAAAATAVPTLLVMIGYMAGMIRHAPVIRAEEREAAAMAARNPGAEFGPTDDGFADVLNSRTAAALAGSTERFGASAWMDFAAAGVRPSDTALFSDCTVGAWILPKGGAPFSLISTYSHKPLFTPAFQAAFRARHRVVEVGQFYPVWRCIP